MHETWFNFLFTCWQYSIKYLNGVGRVSQTRMFLTMLDPIIFFIHLAQVNPLRNRSNSTHWVPQHIWVMCSCSLVDDDKVKSKTTYLLSIKDNLMYIQIFSKAHLTEPLKYGIYTFY